MGPITDATRLPGRGDREPGHDDGPRRHGAAEPEMVGMGFFPDELGLPPSFVQPTPRAGEDRP